jgi:hypothetical protein
MEDNRLTEMKTTSSALSANFDLSTTPIVNPSVIFREGLDNWAVLVNMDTAASIALNPTGILIWKMIDGKRNVESIMKSVKDQFKKVPESFTDDVRSLLAVLFQDGFIGQEVRP